MRAPSLPIHRLSTPTAVLSDLRRLATRLDELKAVLAASAAGTRLPHGACVRGSVILLVSEQGSPPLTVTVGGGAGGVMRVTVQSAAAARVSLLRAPLRRAQLALEADGGGGSKADLANAEVLYEQLFVQFRGAEEVRKTLT